MTAVYENKGLRFQYPENWVLTDIEDQDLPYQFALETPGGAQWSVNVYPAQSTEIEVIAPLSGDVQIYRDFLPENGFAVRFHHLSRMFPDDASFDAQVEQHRRAGRELPILADMGSTGRFFYADYRPELGRYLEGVVFGPDGKKLLATIPR